MQIAANMIARIHVTSASVYRNKKLQRFLKVQLSIGCVLREKSKTLRLKKKVSSKSTVFIFF